MGFKQCLFVTEHEAHQPRLFGWLIKVGAERMYVDAEGVVRAMCQLYQLRAALTQEDFPVTNYWSEHGKQMP